MAGGAVLGCAVPADDADPVPSECDVYRIDTVRPSDEIDNRASAILAAVFRTYAEHDLPGAWQEHLDQRLATDLVWTFETGDCAAPAEIPLGALADIGSLGDGDRDGWHPVTEVTLQLWPQGGELDGRIGGELEPGYAEVIADAFVPFLNQLLAAGDTGWGDSIDTSGDGVIDQGELLGDALFQTLTRPDRGERLSFGFAFHATAL